VCVLCTQTWIDTHWSDPAIESPQVVALETHAVQRGQRLRDRYEQVRLFNRILRQHGLTLQDWEGSSFILRDATGRSAVVPNLAAVWVEAERLTGLPLDPLDPGLIASLRGENPASPPDP
jgi:hypothetical protein